MFERLANLIMQGGKRVRDFAERSRIEGCRSVCRCGCLGGGKGQQIRPWEVDQTRRWLLQYGLVELRHGALQGCGGGLQLFHVVVIAGHIPSLRVVRDM